MTFVLKPVGVVSLMGIAFGAPVSMFATAPFLYSPKPVVGAMMAQPKQAQIVVCDFNPVNPLPDKDVFELRMRVTTATISRQVMITLIGGKRAGDGANAGAVGALRNDGWKGVQLPLT